MEQSLNSAIASTDNEFRAIQIHDCYIVLASDAGLEVIDQHALHERILYEHLRNRILSGGVERQRLLIPDTIECTATECVALLESLDLLKEIGFELQEFGGTTILLMSHPTLIPRGNLARIVKDFAEQLVQNDTSIHRMRVFKKNRKYYFRLQFTSCLSEIAWVDISKRELANYFMKQQYMFEFDVDSE